MLSISSLLLITSFFSFWQIPDSHTVSSFCVSPGEGGDSGGHTWLREDPPNAHASLERGGVWSQGATLLQGHTGL